MGPAQSVKIWKFTNNIVTDNWNTCNLCTVLTINSMRSFDVLLLFIYSQKLVKEQNLTFSTPPVIQNFLSAFSGCCDDRNSSLVANMIMASDVVVAGLFMSMFWLGRPALVRRKVRVITVIKSDWCLRKLTVENYLISLTHSSNTTQRCMLRNAMMLDTPPVPVHW